MLSIKLLKGFRISLHFEILKSNVYFLCFHTERGKKKEEEGGKNSQKIAYQRPEPPVRGD